MKKILLFCILTGCAANAQSVIQTVNSGSILGTASSVSVGEIVVVPQNQNQSQSGLIGIMAQTQSLAVPSLELSDRITVYPNPTVAGIFFKSETSLEGRSVSVFTVTGQLVSEKKITSENGVDLSQLAAGTYLVRFSDGKNKTFKIVKN